MNLARRIATVEGRLPAAARRCRRSSERIRFSSAILPPYARHGLAEERAALPANRGRGAVRGGGSMVETAVFTVREDSNNALARAQDRQGAAGGGEVTTY